MRVWAAHAIFAAILVGSLAAQERAGALDDTASLLESAVLRAVSSHGLVLREYRIANGMFSRGLVFEAPGCSQPVLVSPLLWTFEEETLLEGAPERGAVRRYIYFDRTWDTPDPRAVFVQGMKYRALAMFGLTEYAPSRYLLLVEAPAKCGAAEAIDWRSVWNRNDRAAAQANAEVRGK